MLKLVYFLSFYAVTCNLKTFMYLLKLTMRENDLSKLEIIHHYKYLFITTYLFNLIYTVVLFNFVFLN
jgi:hypothetical protein